VTHFIIPTIIGDYGIFVLAKVPEPKFSQKYVAGGQFFLRQYADVGLQREVLFDFAG